MTPVVFKEINVTFAENQPQYLPLPAHRDAAGIVTTRWRLSFAERIKLLWSGCVWLQQMTFYQPLQPQKPSVDRPELGATP